jgi:uncharacterized protein YlzI (FlbEa/FlbD family)
MTEFTQFHKVTGELIWINTASVAYIQATDHDTTLISMMNGVVFEVLDDTNDIINTKVKIY